MPVVNRFHYLILNPIARGFVISQSKRLKDKSCFSSWSRARGTCRAAGFGR